MKSELERDKKNEKNLSSLVLTLIGKKKKTMLHRAYTSQYISKHYSTT